MLNHRQAGFTLSGGSWKSWFIIYQGDTFLHDPSHQGLTHPKICNSTCARMTVPTVHFQEPHTKVWLFNTMVTCCFHVQCINMGCMLPSVHVDTNRVFTSHGIAQMTHRIHPTWNHLRWIGSNPHDGRSIFPNFEPHQINFIHATSKNYTLGFWSTEAISDYRAHKRVIVYIENEVVQQQWHRH